MTRTFYCSPVTIAFGFFTLALSVGHSYGQNPTWNVPAGGYLPDALSHSIRQVSGFAGSALMGSFVLSGLDWASVAPNQQSALVAMNGTAFWVSNLGQSNLGQTVQTQSLDWLPTPRRAYWAADTSRVVILTSDSQLIWITNLGTSPSQEASWSLPESAGEWRLLAADAAADHVLLSLSANGSAGLWTASKLVSPAATGLSLQPAEAVFAANNDSAFVADAAARQIYKIQGLNSSPTQTTLVASEEDVTAPSGMVLSIAGDRLFVADRQSPLIREFDSVSGGVVTDLPVEEPAHGLSMVSAGRFLLSPSNESSVNPSSRPVLLLDTTEPARVIFIPRGTN